MDEQNQNPESNQEDVNASNAGNDELTELRAKCEEYLSGWKRAQADYANLRREAEREKIEFSKFANERLLSELLPAIDQFEVALDFLPDISNVPAEDQKRLQNWFTGIKAVRGLWETSFRDIGLHKVDTSHGFDPMQQEAVGEEERDGVAEGQIVRVTQSGWKLNGKLLRPAKVILAKAKS